MRIVRCDRGGDVFYGVLSGDGEGGEVERLDGGPYGDRRPTGERHPLAEVRLLAPVEPSKIVAIGRNYAEHAAELGNAVPVVPIVFLKPSTSVVGPDDAVEYPPQSSDVHYEAELAVVIGRRCRSVSAEEFADVVLGYTCANDVSARDLQKSDKQWGRAKGFDTFCPLGPWVETDLDPADLAVRCRVGGELRQDGRTSQMINSVGALIAHVSAAMTLLPGDVLLTGTPAGVGPLTVGDTVEVEVEGVGVLRNRVTAPRPD
ncbi:MAG: fumarylacetoacetate hydrolase family protein [Actinomycetota bacterium]|nr:fumarylacetoacetate hydrolase family protein [Actinomycetota bacterium]